MRLIPGKTKVKIELFRGITLSDVIIGLVDIGLIVFVLTSSLPGNLFICIGLLLLGAALLLRMDSEPNYMYLLHVLRHFGYRRRFKRASSDRDLVKRPETDGEPAAAEPEPPPETPEERKARLKAEREEYAADEKLLRSHKLTKEEEDAIWLKRAQQSAERKKKKKAASAAKPLPDVASMIPFTGIKDNFIEFAGSYYGTVIEIRPVEFRFFSENRRINTIENSFGRLLRSIPGDYAVNIVKIERPTLYEEYLENEYKKLDELRTAYEKGMFSEDELKTRVEVLCDRINDLRDLCFDHKIIQPFYYLVLYDSDRKQLSNLTDSALDLLSNGEMKIHRLDTKELALFLKYSNTLDFDEKDIEFVSPDKYAEWAMPQTLSFQARHVVIDGTVGYTLRVIGYPSMANDAWLATVMSMPATKVVVKCKPMEREKAVRGIDHSLQELRGQFASTGIDSKRIELQEHIETLSELLTMLQGDNESLLAVNIYVTGYDVVQSRASGTSAGDENRSGRVSMNNMKRLLRRTWQENNLKLNGMEFDQIHAFIGSQISAWDPMHASGRGMPSNSLAACYPWIFDHISDPKGIKLGSEDGVPVFIDFFRRDSERVNSNMVIVGKSGSGKSYATKSILTNLAADDSKIFILDPENEYTELAHNLHGKFINVGNAQQGRLNPFHIITGLDDDESDGSTVSGSYATHLQFLEEFFRQILPDCDKDAMEYLNSLIDRMYINMGITAETDLSKLTPEDYPTFDDLYDAVLNEFQSTDNEYIHTMLRTLMNYIAKFSSGGRNANIWNGPSTVTTGENFTVFNFQSLLANRNGSIANAQMLLVLKYIDNEIIKNRDYNTKHGLHRKVVVVIDEAHVFIDTKYPAALDFMFQLAKRIRKYNGMQIVITQNIKDFVGSEEIARKSTAIINACQYSFIFSLAPNDMADLCKLYEKAGGINENEQEQIISAPRGQAFTIMSPQSRSSFKVQVPTDMVEMFRKNEYVSHYFSGPDGEAKWEEFMQGSRELHEASVRDRDVLPDTEAVESGPSSRVTFMEISEEEYAAEAEAAAFEQERKEYLHEARLAASRARMDERGSRPARKGDAAEPQPYDAEDDEGKTAFGFLGGEDEENEDGAGSRKAGKAKPDAAEQRLYDLFGKFSYEAMVEEIRRSVREEVERKLGSSGTGTDTGTEGGIAAVETAGDTAVETAVVAAAGSAAPAESAAPAQNEEENDFGSFDMMKILMEEAANLSDQSPIELMIQYDETVLEVSLEELMQYNASHG